MPDPEHAGGLVARAGRPHRWLRRFATPPSLKDACCAPRRAPAPLTGIHYMAMPDADTRDALEALVNAWRQAADAFGESMLQYAERRMFEGRQVALPSVDTPPPADGAAFAVRAVSNDDVQQFESPMVRIEVRAPDTLSGLGELMVRWAVLADGRAWNFIEIGWQRMVMLQAA
ncbi:MULTISPECIES: hypothetical protein [unclassified Rhizobacter]|uniref:hypothetical protein n=1 Tax=unclassified Rhizobacter TaxID=2640088 RepID=UPI0012F9F3C0|nr:MULTISPECIES: hypothetical protein [unclassified Rhizobacter]